MVFNFKRDIALSTFFENRLNYTKIELNIYLHYENLKYDMQICVMFFYEVKKNIVSSDDALLRRTYLRVGTEKRDKYIII